MVGTGARVDVMREDEGRTYRKFLFVHDLLRALVHDDDARFFQRLEGEVLREMGISRMAVAEQRVGGWIPLYADTAARELLDRDPRLASVTGQELPPFQLTPGSGDGFDGQFAIRCRDDEPRLLLVCTDRPRRVLDADEVNALITIANMVGALLDNHRLLKQDPLTRLANRQSCESSLTTVHRSAVRYDRTYAVAMLDIDHFKQVNDRFGHDAGDHVLRGLAQLLRDSVRSSDFVGRWGGEEFLLIFDAADCWQVKLRLDQILERLRRTPFHVDDHSFNVTFSAGVALLARDGEIDGEDVVKRADAALYAAKRAGRCRVLVEPKASRRGVRLASVT